MLTKSTPVNALPPRAALTNCRLSRRALLLGVSVSLTGAALAACAPKTAQPEPLATVSSPPLRLLPNSQLSVETAAVDADVLATFLAISSLLTGVPELDPGIGASYLAHLQATNAPALAALYEQAGFTGESAPTTLAALEETGVFEQEAMQQLAEQIIELWYTGQYQDEQGEAVVVTFVDALAWKLLDFTKPPTLCGSPNFWAFHPSEAIISS